MARRKARRTVFARRAQVGRLVVCLSALLILLLNPAAMPGRHGAPHGISQAGETGMPPVEAVGGHAHHQREEAPAGDESGTGHQTCHFCRIAGAALPPPIDLLAILLAADEPAWTVVAGLRPPQSFTKAHPARAPPRAA